MTDSDSPSRRSRTEVSVCLRHRHFAALTLALSACIATATFTLIASPATSKKVDLSLRDLDGTRQRLRDFRGKIVVLNFWATWCGPCKDEMPMFVLAQKDYAPRGIVVIGASLDEKGTRGKIPAFLQEYHIDFPIWVGATLDDLEKLGLGHALPATAFLDREGRVVTRVLGQLREEEVKERLEWLTGDQTRPAPEPIVNHLNTH